MNMSDSAEDCNLLVGQSMLWCQDRPFPGVSMWLRVCLH